MSQQYNICYDNVINNVIYNIFVSARKSKAHCFVFLKHLKLFNY